MITSISKFPPFYYVLDPLPHQKEWFLKSRDQEYFAYFWEMGLGKTKPLIDNIAWLYLNREIDGALIVSDKGCYLNWYYEELPKHLMRGLNDRIAFYSSSMRAKDSKKVQELLVAEDDTLDILIINVEALRSKRGYEIAKQFVESHYTMMIVDESTSIKNPRAAQTKAVLRLGTRCDYRRIATGTPITQGPLDLFAQAQFLKPGLLGFKSFVAFRSYYADIRTITAGPRSFPKLFGYRNIDELIETIKPWSSRLTKDEVLDLPEKTYETVIVEHTMEQATAYFSMKSLMMANFDNEVVSVTSALTAVMKLHQINCGHIKDNEGHTISIPNNRGYALESILSRISNTAKFIVWCNFREDINEVGRVLTEMGIEYVAYHGGVTSEDRQIAIHNFKNDPQVRGFVGTASAGGKGLTLIEASYVIYYSNNYSLEKRLQSEDRAHRIGQTRGVTYIDLIVPGTVDEKIVNALRDKKDLADTILDDWRSIL